MPKQLHEIKHFNKGVHITPADTDIPEEAADFSLNIDSMAKDGVLRGMNKDLIKYYRDSGDTVRSTFNGAQSHGATTLTITSASSFSSSGNVVFTDSKGYVQYLAFSGKTSTTLTSVTGWRANQGTILDGNGIYQVSSPDNFVSHSSGMINNENQRHLVYFDDTDDKIKKIDYLYSENNQTAPYLAAVSSSSEAFTGRPSFVPNNKEVHIGMGDGATNKPLWCGIIGHGQFGASASTDLQLTDAELKAPSTMPPFDKIIKIGSFLYGAQDGDTKVYSMTASTGAYKNSSYDIFSSIVSIAYHDANTFWVLDKVSSTVAELKLIDASSFEVTQTSTITGIRVRADKTYDDDVPNDDEHDETFSDWFTTNTGGGANFITDIIETSGKMWYIRGCGPTDTHADCIKWRFLFRSDIPTSTDNLRVYDVSFRTVMEGHGHGANVEGVFYEDNDGAGATDEIDVTLQIPYKGLVDCGAAAGVILSVYHQDGGEGELSLRQDSENVALRSNTDKRSTCLFIFADTAYANYGSFYTNELVKSSASDYNHGFRVRRLTWGSSDSEHENQVISSASYDGVTGSTLAIAHHDSDSSTNIKRTRIAVETGTNYQYADATHESVNQITAVQGNISLDANDHPTYEMQLPMIIGIDDGSGTTVYLSRGSKGLSTNKHQFLKSTNTDGTAANADGTDTLVYSTESDLSVGFTEIGTDAIWPTNTNKIFYKMSYTYDGYQESPLSNVFLHSISAATKRLRLNINIHNVSGLSPRVSHLNVYSASSTNSGAQGPDGFYRLVTTLKIDSSFTSSSSDEDGSYPPAWGTIRTREYLDNGKATSSYEARTGINESLSNTIPNYSLSASLNNQLFVARCSHEDIDDAGNYLFKSRPYNFDQFNWAQDFLVLPTYPTAITSYNGRIYVFDENNTYRIEPNNLYIEDVFEGAGCFSQRSVSVTDYGMCFADKHNIYLHNGKQAQPISIPINGNLGDSYAWHTIDTDWDPIIRFYNKYKSFIVFFKASDGKYRIWSFNIVKQRWDLWEWGQVHGDSDPIATEPTDVFVGRDGDINVSSNNKWYYLWDDINNQRNWDWQSKKITLGQDTQIKRFNDFHVTGSPSGSLGTNLYLKVDGANVAESGSLTTFTIDAKSGKYIRWYLEDQSGEVDALGTVYRRKVVTAEQ